MQRSVGTLLDLLFPPRCAACGSTGAALCIACYSAIVRFSGPRCRRCDLPLAARAAVSSHCHACRRQPSHTLALEGLRVVGPHESPLREAIHAFKYAGRRDTGTRLAALLVERWQDAPITVDGVIPVPLHEARERERGYNQSRVLAEPFARQAGLPLRPGVLERTRPTPPQVGLDRAGRLDNVAGAFQATTEAIGGRWLLVDDVCTTGATLEACAAALRGAGATSVWAITLARPHAHEGAGSPGNL